MELYDNTKFCGKLQCPNCNRTGKCTIISCNHPEISNSKILYFPTMLGGKVFQTWTELNDWICKTTKGEYT